MRRRRDARLPRTWPALRRRRRTAGLASSLVALALALLPARQAAAADIDNDGLQDNWELEWFGTTLVTPTDDPDADGLDNLAEQAAGTAPILADSDGDSLTDGAELNAVPPTDPTNPDSDGDFLDDGAEVLLTQTDPLSADTDSDGLTDGAELNLHQTDPLLADTDGGFTPDGQEVLVDGTDPTNPADDSLDTDGDGLGDWAEVNIHQTSPTSIDTDNDLLLDGEEVLSTGTNPAASDTDGDGLPDGVELGVASKTGFGDQDPDTQTDPLDDDTDDDGLLDGEEDTNASGQLDAGESDATVPDTDDDGLSDLEELQQWGTDPQAPDTDGGGVFDIIEVLFDGTDPNAASDDSDADADGLSDTFEAAFATDPSAGAICKVQSSPGPLDPNDADTDGDGLGDGQECLPLADKLITLPWDADSDNDGLLDGNEAGNPWPTQPNKKDSDNDGVVDGVELGLTAPEVSAKDPDATDLAVFSGDADPGSTTEVGEEDSDGDGLLDGEEDSNGNGAWEPLLGETDPNNPDTDGDGMPDGWEAQFAGAGGVGKGLDPLADDAGPAGSCPGDPGADDPAIKAAAALFDADFDGDGLTNLCEYLNAAPGSPNGFGDNPTDPRDPDSDGDGLSDLVEASSAYATASGVAESDPNKADTDGDGLSDGVEDADASGATEAAETSAVVADSDDDGLSDGAETGGDGVIDAANGDTDPNNPDSDGDGLLDGQEVTSFGTDPNSGDSDGDGLGDALELALIGDADPSTKTNPNVADTDGDGLTDGAEDSDADGAVGAGETNPTLKDTDLDGLSDGLEVGLVGDADSSTTTDPLKKDTDGDGLLDGAEDADKDGAVGGDETDPNNPDSDGGGTSDGVEFYVDGTDPTVPTDDFLGDNDGDGLANAKEATLGTDPDDADSDGDGISDFEETAGGKVIDSDGDGTPDATDTDSDNDGYPDAVEAGDAATETEAVDTDGDLLPDYLDLDSDDDGLPDSDELALGTDRRNTDTDADGLQDGPEVAQGSDPTDADTDDDGLLDGLEVGGDPDGDGLAAVLDVDSDDDGLFDGLEAGLTVADLTAATDLAARAFSADVDPASTTNPLLADTDGDGWRDGREDANHNGAVDADEGDPTDGLETVVPLDSDGDGLADAEELVLGTSPSDVDSDDDGVPDGDEHNPGHDLDRDGLTHAADADGDGDGLTDGTERGLTTATAGTDMLRGHAIADADPTTTTSPLLADSDGDGLLDGHEDSDGNGRLDGDESDPNDVGSALTPPDGDGDGWPDAAELRCGLDPGDADSDDDGVPDGAEADPCLDHDGDGLPSALDADSDNDGLLDGSEAGVVVATLDTDASRGRFSPDLDPSTRTDVQQRDTDGDGLPDGLEDINGDGALSAGETDPADATDVATRPDGDGDGLPDAVEAVWGTNSADDDSDDDGLLDSLEPNPTVDDDGDGLTTANDPDADNDGLPDGLEAGVDSDLRPPGTSLGAGRFVADADPQTTTFVLRADTDGGGVSDGVEDWQRNGRVDAGETDPRVAADDAPVDGDLDGDGLSNADELGLGTNPLDADTDGDQIPDGVEVGGDPSAPRDTDGDGDYDALDTDSDGDGISDADEAGDTPATPRDTDGDGLPDYRDTDSDDDGLPDALEVSVHKTSPTNPDTDGGGVGDGAEVLVEGTDPLDPSDDEVRLEPGAAIRGSAVWRCSSTPGGATPSSAHAGAILLLLGFLALLRRRRQTRHRRDQRGRWAAAALVALALVGAADQADAGSPAVVGLPANLDGTGIGHLDTATSGALLVPVGGLQLAWLRRPLVVARDKHVLRELVGQRLQTDLTLGLRLLERWTVGARLPIAAWQQGERPAPRGDEAGSIRAFAIGDPAAWTKLVLTDDRIEPVGWALVASVAVGAGDDDAYLSRGPFSGHAQLVASGRTGRTRWVVGVGAQLAARETTYNIDDGAAWMVDAGMQYAPATIGRDRWWLEATLAWRTPLRAPLQDANLERVEVVGGAGTELGGGLILRGGLGLGAWPGFGVPSVRPHVGVQWQPAGAAAAFSAPDTDGDGFDDPSDLCPLEAEDRDGFKDDDGCPDPDNDGDGIADAEDRCPDEAEDRDGFADTDGCPDDDDDKDGVPDRMDRCPWRAEDPDGFEDHDGCPENDDDGDGIVDRRDRCPRKAEDFDGFADRDGCPEADNDRDGIEDLVDRCPLDPETWNGVDDKDGCPDRVVVGPVALDHAAARIELAEPIAFGRRSARLEASSAAVLDAIARLLAGRTDVATVLIEGHCAEAGNPPENQALSEARAQAVRTALIKRGVESTTLQAHGYGDARPVLPRPRGRAERQANSRIELQVVLRKGPNARPATPTPDG